MQFPAERRHALAHAENAESGRDGLRGVRTESGSVVADGEPRAALDRELDTDGCRPGVSRRVRNRLLNDAGELATRRRRKVDTAGEPKVEAEPRAIRRVVRDLLQLLGQRRRDRPPEGENRPARLRKPALCRLGDAVEPGIQAEATALGPDEGQLLRDTVVQLARHAPALTGHGRSDGPAVAERSRVREEEHQGDEEEGSDDPVGHLEAPQGQRADNERGDARAGEYGPARPPPDRSVPVPARWAACAYGQFRSRRASATVCPPSSSGSAEAP